MDNQSSEKKNEPTVFKIGDLVRYELFQQGKHPQTWQRFTGIGVIVSMNPGRLNTNYTVWANGKSFDCTDVFPITSSEAVRNVNENETK